MKVFKRVVPRRDYLSRLHSDSTPGPIEIHRILATDMGVPGNKFRPESFDRIQVSRLEDVVFGILSVRLGSGTVLFRRN